MPVPVCSVPTYEQTATAGLFWYCKLRNALEKWFSGTFWSFTEWFLYDFMAFIHNGHQKWSFLQSLSHTPSIIMHIMSVCSVCVSYDSWIEVWRKSPQPELPPWVAWLTRLPSLLFLHGKHASQFESIWSRLLNIHKSLEVDEPPLGCYRSAGRGRRADWGQQNAKSTHVCNGYTEVIVQRDPQPPLLPSPLPLPPPPHHNIN